MCLNKLKKNNFRRFFFSSLKVNEMFVAERFIKNEIKYVNFKYGGRGTRIFKFDYFKLYFRCYFECIC